VIADRSASKAVPRAPTTQWRSNRWLGNLTWNIRSSKTEVVPVKGQYGVSFEFDDGYTDFAEVGDKATAEFYAAVQLGERIPMNVNPLLLSAAKAETLRRKGTK
jgi:hypothetical protein